jgi:hypothetical protein
VYYKILHVSTKEVAEGAIRVLVREVVLSEGKYDPKSGVEEFWVILHDASAIEQAEDAVKRDRPIQLWDDEVPFNPKAPAKEVAVTVI